jgi:lipopolysaccharide/colanic/teichoic acid biosynthesis glycosyltransferase
MAGLFLVVIFPALAAAALAIAFLSRRSPLIAHLRVGQHGRNIWVLKLRTMWQQRSSGCRLRPFIERLTGEEIPESKSQTDARVTSRFAAVCRKYSVDEWPQLWHVIRGEMALVGPRPLTAAELDRYYGSSTALLLSVKPGITGLWQVKGRSRLTYPQRRRLDLFLIHHRCLRLYARILNATIPRVVTGKDAW